MSLFYRKPVQSRKIANNIHEQNRVAFMRADALLFNNQILHPVLQTVFI